MTSRFSRRLLALSAAAVLLAPVAVHAQYIWLNDKGQKQYSDMPPPAHIPKNKILKSPDGVSAPQSSSEEPDSSAKGAPAAKAPLTTAEREAEYRKRKTEEAEKEKKAADEAQRAADKARHCERARAYQRSLESGQRIARSDAKGERYYLDDAQRAQEVQQNQRALANCQ